MKNTPGTLIGLALVVSAGLLWGCSREEPVVKPAPKKAAPAPKVMVVIEGVAKDAKAGAVLETGDKVVYINGLSAWPAGTAGQRLKLKGELRTIQPPATSIDPMGRAVQGTVGTQHVLHGYSRVEPETPKDR